MRKNGFTLIELLAVIVILAIIALIATPIILGIINDAREKANERSVELYAAAVKNGIAAYQLTGLNAPKSFSDLTIQYDGDVKCSVQELYEDGSFYLEGCKVNNSKKEYSYGTKQGTTIEVGKMSICNPINIQTAGIYTAGDKYECDVDPNKEGYDYIFYVLNSTATEVNLIMDSNINISGEAVKSDDIDDKGFVAWYADGYDSSYGPITAMNYLQTATASWTNTKELTINKFTVCPYFGNCTEKPMTEYIVNARMPYYGEISDYNKEANNAYLYDNLSFMCWDDLDGQEVSCSDPSVDDVLGLDVEGLEHVRDVYGYWLLSSLGDSGPSVYSVWFVYNRGYVGERRANEDVIDVYNDGGAGVRPVINLSI